MGDRCIMRNENKFVLGGKFLGEVKDDDNIEGVVKFNLEHETPRGKVYIFLVKIDKQRYSEVSPHIGSFLEVSGELRTYKLRIGGKDCRTSFLQAREICAINPDTVLKNAFTVVGDVRSVSDVRRGTNDEPICDFNIRIIGSNNRYSYPRCSAWFSLADKASKLGVDDVVRVSGVVNCRELSKDCVFCTVMVTSLEVYDEE